MSHLAELGWICVAINYRHSPRNTWPDHIIDVKRALAWVKAHISEYGGDPDFIAITGGSAGGHLSSLAALTPNDPRFQPGFEEADTRVQAAVPFYGVYDFTRLQDAMHPMMLPLLERMVVKQPRTANMQSYLDASPVTHISADAPHSLCYTAATTRWFPYSRRVASSISCGKSASSRWYTPNCPLPSTLSTCSARHVRHTRRSPWSNSWPRSTQRNTRAVSRAPRLRSHSFGVEVARVGLVKLLSPLDQMFARMEAPRTPMQYRRVCGLRPA